MFPQKPLLQPSHPSAVALVIVSEKVQKAMQGQHAKLNRSAMSPLARLAPSDAAGNDDIAQELIRRSARL